MRYRYIAGFLICLFSFCIYLSYVIYKEAKEKAIYDLNSRQMILANQAQGEIEIFFNDITSFLTNLSTSEHVINFDHQGKDDLDFALSIRPEGIKAITRVDKQGRIIYTTPYNPSVIGKDISWQTHVQKILKTRKPVVSDVFQAVQGYPAIALHVPVYKESDFNGTLAVLIDFLSISKRFLRGIRLGETGYAWMTSREGIELYCPVPGHIGRSVFETSEDFPTILTMARKMLKGEKGTTVYKFDRVRDKKVETIKKHAVYQPIKIVDSFWTIVIASTETEMLSALVSFKNKLLLVVGLLLTCIGVFSYYTFTAWKIVRQEEERKKTQKALQLSHERFLMVLNSIDAAIYAADLKTHEILFMNDYMVEIFGRNSIGEICWKAFRGQAEPCSNCKNNQLIDKNGNPFGVNTWQDKNPVVNKWFVYSERVIEWTTGRLAKLQIATDISQIKVMEEELRQVHKMESIGTMAGGIAHDFNNFLYMILGNAELMLDELPEYSPLYSHIEEIKSASIRASGIVKQLLNFSRKTDQELKPINVIEVINDGLKLLRSSIPVTIDIINNLPDEAVIISGDPIQINQVLINICTNSAQALEKTGGTIEIKGKKVFIGRTADKESSNLLHGNFLKIVIQDSGPGISDDIIDRIFDPYFTTKGIGEGSGMGLAVVHGIVKNHNGLISVRSRKNEGAAFKLLFPVVQESPDIDIVPAARIPYGSETILFVDDEEAITQMTGNMLTKLGYKIQISLNPDDAFDIFKSDPAAFDLIITDMTMPQMTGAKLAEKIAHIRPDIPVIICTGHSSLIDEEKARELGIAGYVMKPITMAEIAKTIRDVLDA